jgi:hypothetical protein
MPPKKQTFGLISMSKQIHLSQKRQWQPKKIEWYTDLIKSITQHSYFEKKPNK